MNPELPKNLLYLIGLSILGYSINKALFFLPFAFPEVQLQISIEYLFVVFAVLSAIILSVVVLMKKKSFDNVGMTFLLLTTIKMGVAFFVKRVVIAEGSSPIEKINFYGIFVFFLVIETILTIQLLNKKLEK